MGIRASEASHLASVTSTVVEVGALRRESSLFSPRGLKVRLFLTCWLVYMLHFSPYVYRELYLTMSLAEKHTIHVDDYVDLHPDLFVMPGRGSFLGNNPGASILAAVPYWFSLPVVNRVAPVRKPQPQEAASAVYNNRYTDRQDFYRKVRERGLDMHLGAAAAITACFFMAPLTALSAVVIFILFRRMKFPSKVALWLSLLYAFGTPVFFRTATISLNLVVALLGLFAFALMWWPEASVTSEPARFFAAGVIAGYTVVTDYSGVITVGSLALFALLLHMQACSFWSALRRSLWYVAGTVGPICFMLFWQWYCYGNPWLPAQFHMPKRFFMGYTTDRGVGWPMASTFEALMTDPLFGMVVFAPILTLALYHFALVRRRVNLVPNRVAAFAWAYFAFLWVFFSCVQYTTRFQWQDGFRYMVPAVPFLFLLVADVLVRVPRSLAALIAFAAVAETWCLVMVRENPLESIERVLLHGFELPWLTTMVNAAPQYFPILSGGASPVPLFVFSGVLVWGIWKFKNATEPMLPSGDLNFQSPAANRDGD